MRIEIGTMSAFNRNLRIIAALVVLNLLLPLPAFAGRIVLNWGAPKITFTPAGDEILVEGKISISNSGDEKTLDVSPQIRVGSWDWAGEQQDIEAGTNSTWTVSAKFPKAKLDCTADPACAGLALPPVGEFPLILRIAYHDLNHYAFSGLGVLVASIGIDDKERFSASRLPTVLSMVKISGPAEEADVPGMGPIKVDADGFDATIELSNVTDRKVDAAVSLLTATEVLVQSPPQAYNLSPHSMVEKSVKLKNFSGLVGNDFLAIAVVQWENNGFRLFSQANRLFKLSPPDPSSTFLPIIWGLSGFSAALAAGAIYLFFRRPRAKSDGV